MSGDQVCGRLNAKLPPEAANNVPPGRQLIVLETPELMDAARPERRRSVKSREASKHHELESVSQENCI